MDITTAISTSEFGAPLKKVLLDNVTGLLHILFGEKGKYIGPFANGNTSSQEWITFCILVSTWVTSIIPHLLASDVSTKPSDIANLTIDLVTLLITREIIPFKTEEERRGTLQMISLARGIIIILIIQNVEKIDTNIFSCCMPFQKNPVKKILIAQSTDLAEKAKIISKESPET